MLYGLSKCPSGATSLSVSPRAVPLSFHYHTRSLSLSSHDLQAAYYCDRAVIWTLLDKRDIEVSVVDRVWNVMARRNGRVHLNRRGRQFNRLMAAEACASAVVMLDTPPSELVRRVLAAHSIPQFPLEFHSRASPCAFTFQLDS